MNLVYWISLSLLMSITNAGFNFQITLSIVYLLDYAIYKYAFIFASSNKPQTISTILHRCYLYAVTYDM